LSSPEPRNGGIAVKVRNERNPVLAIHDSGWLAVSQREKSVALQVSLVM